MPTPRGAYSQRGHGRGTPLRGVARGALYQRGFPRGALSQQAGRRGSYSQRRGRQGARRENAFSPPAKEGQTPPAKEGQTPPAKEGQTPPAEEIQGTLWMMATQLCEMVKTREWRQFWQHMPVRRRCAVCVDVQAGAWAAAALAAAGGAGGTALLVARMVRAEAWAAVYADRAALLAYMTALAAVASLLLLPAAAVLVVGLALQSYLLVEGYLWAVLAHLVADWLATGFMVTYCLAEPACLRGTCSARAHGVDAAFLVTGTVLMLGYSAAWTHLLITVHSFRHTFQLKGVECQCYLPPVGVRK